MTNPSDERISALIDGELDVYEQQKAVDELLAHDENRKAWGRYHLISDTLKHSLPTSINHDFSSRVMAALDDEPTVLAPASRASWGQRAAGLAVAASVAAVAVLGVQFIYQQDVQAPVPQLAQQGSSVQDTTLMAKKNAERVGMQSNIQTVTQSASTAGNATIGGVKKGLKRFHPHLNKYLVDHNQQASQAVQGVVPYARIVAYPNSHRILIQAQK
jgi:sigma-E factor negative regulatory protein RseA